MNITSVQGRKIIHKGDTTTTGGTVLEGSHFSEHGSLMAIKGNLVFCPACKKIGKITEGSSLLNINGIPVALEGHKVSCGCSEGCLLVVLG